MQSQATDGLVPASTPVVRGPSFATPGAADDGGPATAFGTLVSDSALARGATLIVAPHGDDELLGCGGWLLRSAGKARRGVVFVTHREEVRHRESVQALQGLDVEVYDLSLPEGKPWPRKRRTAAAAELAARFVALDPAYLLVPNEADPHRDHRRSHELVRDALRHHLPPAAPPALQVLRYEGLVPLADANWWLDVSGHLDAKLDRLGRYASQDRRYRLVELARSLNTYRGGTLLRRGITAAEAFRRSSTAEYLR